MVSSIDLKKKIVKTLSGDEVCYNKLISSLPLDLFLDISKGFTHSVRDHKPFLEAIGLRLVLLKCTGRLSQERHRLYSAESHVPFHKLVFQNTSSPFLAERKFHGLLAEVSDLSTAKLNDRQLIDETIESLVINRIIPSKDTITDATIISVPRAYPVQLLGKAAMLHDLKKELSNLDVHLLGRFAEWDYINSDQVMNRAFALSRAIRAADLSDIPARCG